MGFEPTSPSLEKSLFAALGYTSCSTRLARQRKGRRDPSQTNDNEFDNENGEL